MLHQLRAMRLLRLMDKTDESRAALARAEKRYFAGDDDQHADDQHEGTSSPRRVNSSSSTPNEASSIFRTNEHTSCNPIKLRIITTNPNFFLSRTSPSPSSCFSPSPPPKEKRRRTIMKSPDYNSMSEQRKTRRIGETDNKMSKRKIRRIGKTRNVEAPTCQSQLPNVGINDSTATSSASSIGVVSIENALGTMDNNMANDDDYEKDFEGILFEDDFFGFEDLKCLW